MPSTTTDRISGLSTSVAVKAPCRVATTANITLSGEQTIDGVAVVSGDRVLVKSQTTASENGIYVADTSAWQRAKDFDGARDVVQGTLVYVVSGSTQSNSFWQVTTSGTITIGTTSISFSQSNTTLQGVSSFMQTVLDDTTAAAARTTLGALASDISTLTAETSPAIDDKLALYDTSAATTDRIDLSVMLGVVNSLTEDTAPAGASDFALTYDTSATSAKKVKPTNLLKAINDLSTIAVDPAADYIPFYDTSGTVAGKALASSLKSASLLGSTTYTTNTTLTTVVPLDDTVPQNTEGTQIMSVAVTPTSASSTLVIEWEIFSGAATTGVHIIAPLFKDSGASALGVAYSYYPSNGNTINIKGCYSESSGSTSARTYKINLGASSGDCYPNGIAATRRFGGISACVLRVYEFT